jgi:hypothetical protein
MVLDERLDKRSAELEIQRYLNVMFYKNLRYFIAFKYRNRLKNYIFNSINRNYNVLFELIMDILARIKHPVD